MVDQADRADREIDTALAHSRWLAAQQAQAAPALRSKGRCHYCDEEIAAPLLFCDKACAEDHAEEEAKLKRLGRR